MKRILGIILTLSMLLGFIPGIVSFAETPVVDSFTLDTAFTDGRSGGCFFGQGSLGGSPYQQGGTLWSQSTNQDGYKYNSAAMYASPVTFNTYTVINAGDSYDNYAYAEIWYYNGALTGADPLTYWTKADLQAVVVSTGAAADALCNNTFAGANGIAAAYTWILSAPVTANNVMVNFVYDDSRADGEGNCFQYLSFAGYDADFVEGEPEVSEEPIVSEEPVESEPVESEPVESEPVESEPVVALPVLPDLSIENVFTDGRSGFCFYGPTGNPYQVYTGGGAAWNQSTNQGGFQYNSAVSYSAPVTFNTFTAFSAGNLYENNGFAEIWYYDGELTGANPLTYWTKAELQGVVVSNGADADALCGNTFPGANNIAQAYTWILTAPVTAKHVMVNFAYDDSRADGEGNCFMYLSFAGYDVHYKDGAYNPDVETEPVVTEPVDTSVPVEDTVQTILDVYFTCQHDADYNNMSFSMQAGSITALMFQGWNGCQSFNDGGTPYTWFIKYNNLTWINQIKVLAKNFPAQRFLNTVGVYTSDDGENWTVQYGNWRNAEYEGDYFIFDFDEDALCTYVMLHMEVPAEIKGFWKPNEGVITSYLMAPPCYHDNAAWEVITEGDCSTEGLSALVCPDCGETLDTKTTPAGHAFGDWEITVPANGFTAGEKSQSCEICGETNTEVYYNTFGVGDADNTDKIVAGIPSEMDAADLEAYFAGMGLDVAIEISGDYVGTGSTITVGDDVYTVIVKGDTTGDGAVDIFDLSGLLTYVNGDPSLEGVFVKAGLIVNEEEPDIFDLSTLLAVVNGEAEL